MARKRSAMASTPKKMAKKAKVEPVDPILVQQKELSSKMREVSQFGFGPEEIVVNIHCNIIENTMQLLSEDRSANARKAIDFSKELHSEIQSSMNSRMVELQAIRDSADRQLETLETQKSSCEKVLEDKKEFSLSEKSLLSEKKEETKQKKQELTQCEKRLKSQNKDLDVVKDEIATLDGVNAHATQWVNGADRSTVSEQAQNVLDILNHFEADGSLVSTMSHLLKKDTDLWGQFDMLSLNYAADFLSKKNQEWLAKKQEMENSITTTEAELAKIQSDYNQLVEEQSALSERVSSATVDQSEANSQLNAKIKEIKDHRKETAENPENIKDLEEKLNSFKQFLEMFLNMELRTEIEPTPSPSPEVEPQQVLEEPEQVQEQPQAEEEQPPQDQAVKADSDHLAFAPTDAEVDMQPLIPNQSPVKENTAVVQDIEMKQMEPVHDDHHEAPKPVTQYWDQVSQDQQHYYGNWTN